MARVRVEKLVKVFPGGVQALKGISFEVQDGEFFVLLGPSGCGKTTTLRIIAGLEKPTSGKVYIDGEDVTDLPPKDRDVAMVFQTWALYPHMKVYDNIAFPLKIKGLRKEEIGKKVKEIAKLLRIEELLDRYPKQLSGGQQQRVALARALVRRPRVWLLDEPLSNLDALLRVYMRAELKRLQREFNVTTIYVTHDQVEAMTMADRIAVMSEGIIMQIDKPLEIYNNPKTLFVARFIGVPPMNFIKCTIIEKDGIYLDCVDFKYRVKETLWERLKDYVGREVMLGFRPEHAKISTSPSEESIPGTIYVIEPLGSEMIIDIKVGETIVKIKLPLSMDLLSISGNVYVTPDPERIHIFDVKTGKAIL